MALIQDDQLIGLPVVTASSVALGCVRRIILDTETRIIFYLEVRRRLGFWKNAVFRVNRDQIVAISSHAVVVSDELIQTRDVVFKTKKPESALVAPSLRDLS